MSQVWSELQWTLTNAWSNKYLHLTQLSPACPCVLAPWVQWWHLLMTSATTLCAITYDPAPSHLWLTTVAINIGIISAKVSSRHVTQATRHFRVWHVSGDWGNLMGSSQDLNGKLTSSDARELGRHLSVFLNIWWCITLMKYKIHSELFLKIVFVFNASLHNFWMLYKLRRDSRETFVNAETQDTACFEYLLNTAEQGSRSTSETLTPAYWTLTHQ